MRPRLCSLHMLQHVVFTTRRISIFRKLHCPRNTVHMNLFISFIFRAVLSFLKDILMVQGLGFSFDVEKTSLDSVVFIHQGSVSI